MQAPHEEKDRTVVGPKSGQEFYIQGNESYVLENQQVLTMTLNPSLSRYR